MWKRNTAWLILISSLSAACGCLQTRTACYDTCLKPVEEVYSRAPARAKVYTFLFNGADPLDCTGMKSLEHQIVSAGYPKLYYAQRFDGDWYETEIHRLHRDDPQNRFVLVGLGLACNQMHQLAAKVTLAGIELDQVIELDPICIGQYCQTEAVYPIRQIVSHNWQAKTQTELTDHYQVANVGHWSLAAQPTTAALIVDVLQMSASRVGMAEEPVDCVPKITERDVQPRPNEAKPQHQIPAAWAGVLCPVK